MVSKHPKMSRALETHSTKKERKKGIVAHRQKVPVNRETTGIGEGVVGFSTHDVQACLDQWQLPYAIDGACQVYLEEADRE